MHIDIFEVYSPIDAKVNNDGAKIYINKLNILIQ